MEGDQYMTDDDYIALHRHGRPLVHLEMFQKGLIGDSLKTTGILINKEARGVIIMIPRRGTRRFGPVSGCEVGSQGRGGGFRILDVQELDAEYLKE